MTKLDEPTFDSVPGNWTEPWKFNISKYLMTEDSSFQLEYVNYTKYRPDTSWPVVRNEKCGNLKYEIVHKSYAESWEEDDILEKPLTEKDYFEEFGTIHLL